MIVVALIVRLNNILQREFERGCMSFSGKGAFEKAQAGLAKSGKRQF